MGNLVEVARFYDPEEAVCAKGFLLSHGIDTYVQNEHYLTMAPWMRFALNGYGLQVMASSEGEALQLLKSVGAADSATNDLLLANDPGEDDAQNARPARNWLWFPVALATSIPFLPRNRSGLPALMQHGALLALYALILISWTSLMMWVSGEH